MEDDHEKHSTPITPKNTNSEIKYQHLLAAKHSLDVKNESYKTSSAP